MSPRTRRGERPYYPEQLAAACELGIDPEKDTLLMKLAHDMCRPESLPKSWTARLCPEQGRREYVDSTTGEKQFQHPLIGYYKGAIYMERGGYERLIEKDSQRPPTMDDIYAMAAYLGIRREEHAFVLEVARMAVSASLPPHWVEIVDRNEDVSYRNSETGETSKTHPLDVYFLELRNRRRKEARKNAAQQNSLGVNDMEDNIGETDETLTLLQSGMRPRPRRQEPDPQEEPTNPPTEPENSGKVCSETGVMDKVKVVLSTQNEQSASWRKKDSILFANDEAAKTRNAEEIVFDEIVEDGRLAVAIRQELNRMLEANKKSATDHDRGCLVLVCSGHPSTSPKSSKVEALRDFVLDSEKDLEMHLKTIVSDDSTKSISKVLDHGCVKTKKQLEEALIEVDKTTQKLKCRPLSLHFVEFHERGSLSPRLKICFVDMVQSSPAAAESSVDDVNEEFLFELLFLHADSAPSNSAGSGPKQSAKGAVLDCLERREVFKDATLVFDFQLDFTEHSMPNWATRCRNLICCLRDLRTGITTSAARSQRIELEVLKASLKRLKLSDGSSHQLCADLKEQLDQICQRIGELATEHPSLTPSSDSGRATFDASMETLQLWANLRSEQSYNLQLLQDEALDLKDKLAALETENVEIKTLLEEAASEATQQEALSQERSNHAVQTVKNELAAARQKEEEMTHTLEERMSELRRLRKETERMETMATELRSYEAQIGALRNKVERAQNDKCSCHTELDRLKEQHSALEDHLALLKENEIRKGSLLVCLQEELEACRKASTTQETENQHLQERARCLTSEIAALKEARETTSNELERSKSSVLQLEASMEKLEQEKENHKHFSAQLEEQARLLNHTIDELRISLDGREKEKEHMDRRLEDAEKMKDQSRVLERDKAILLDKLEGITGKPMGDIYDETPPLAFPVKTPQIESSPKKELCTAEQALSSISRITRMAYASSDSPSSKSPSNDVTKDGSRQKPGGGKKLDLVEVVMDVRKLRSERDELRRRDRRFREDNAQLKKKLRVADGAAKKSMDEDLEQLATKLDTLTGIQPPTHLTALDRLKIGVDGVSLLQEEMLSLQRQHGSIALLLKQEERRFQEKERENKLQRQRQIGNGEDAPESEEVSLEADQEALKHEIKQYASISGHRSHDMIGSAALRYARSKEYDILKLEMKISELEQERDRWKTLHEQRSRHPGMDGMKGDLFKWKSAPLNLQKHYSTDLRSFASPNPASTKKKPLPLISQSSAFPSKLFPTRSGIPGFATPKQNGGFDSRPVPAEVKVKLNRVQDQLLRDKSIGKAEKDEHKEAMENFLTGDPRDVEITNLKIRLVRAEKERTEMATKATQDKRESQMKLHQAARILEQAQHLTEQLKEAVLGMPLNGDEGEEMIQFAASMMDAFLARVERLDL